MIYLKDFKQGKLLYEALDSDIRLGILDELLQKGELNLAHFAQHFNVSNGAITAHIKKLYEAGLIEITTSSGRRGTQKICRLAADKIVIDFINEVQAEGRVESAHIDIGHYVSYDIHPTCGLGTSEKAIDAALDCRKRPSGAFDDPCCFFLSRAHQGGASSGLRGGTSSISSPIISRPSPSFWNCSFPWSLRARGARLCPPTIRATSTSRSTATSWGYFKSRGEYNDRTGNCNPAWWCGKPRPIRQEGCSSSSTARGAISAGSRSPKRPFRIST